MDKAMYQRWRMNEEEKARVKALNNSLNSKGQALSSFYSKPMAAGVGGALALTTAYNLLNSNDLTDINPVMTALAGAGAGAAWGRHRQGTFGRNMLSMRDAVTQDFIAKSPGAEPGTIEAIADNWIQTNAEGMATLGKIPKPDPVDGWGTNSYNQASTWLANVMSGGERGRMMREVSRMQFQDDADVLANAYELAQKINARRASQSAAEASGSVPKPEPAPATTADRGSPVPPARVEDLHKGMSQDVAEAVVQSAPQQRPTELEPDSIISGYAASYGAGNLKPYYEAMAVAAGRFIDEANDGRKLEPYKAAKKNWLPTDSKPYLGWVKQSDALSNLSFGESVPLPKPKATKAAATPAAPAPTATQVQAQEQAQIVQQAVAIEQKQTRPSKPKAQPKKEEPADKTKLRRRTQMLPSIDASDIPPIG